MISLHGCDCRHSWCRLLNPKQAPTYHSWDRPSLSFFLVPGTVLTPDKDMFHPQGSPSFLHFLKFGCTGSSLRYANSSSWGMVFSSFGAPALLPLSMWDLSSLTKDQTCIPCIERQILNHWVTRQIPHHFFYRNFPQAYIRVWYHTSFCLQPQKWTSL